MTLSNVTNGTQQSQTEQPNPKQNTDVPIETLTARQQKRIPQIFQMELKGSKQNEIAAELGVSRMQIWRDKKTDLYQYMVITWMTKYEEKLLELINGDNIQYVNEAIKEIGRMIRGLKPKEIHQRTEGIQVNIMMHGTLKNEEKEAQN